MFIDFIKELRKDFTDSKCIEISVPEASLDGTIMVSISMFPIPDKVFSVSYDVCTGLYEVTTPYTDKITSFCTKSDPEVIKYITDRLESDETLSRLNKELEILSVNGEI